MTDRLTYDYSRSFVQWWDNHSHHSPRCAILASCKLRSKDGYNRCTSSSAISAQGDGEVLAQP
ncbi:MAG: hypothetical protein HY360_17110 [Verrucomicrobia bacterium]|nr:hypothetical protein [Verrucomicrobiota bacterium]